MVEREVLDDPEDQEWWRTSKPLAAPKYEAHNLGCERCTHFAWGHGLGYPSPAVCQRSGARQLIRDERAEGAACGPQGLYFQARIEESKQPTPPLRFSLLHPPFLAAMAERMGANEAHYGPRGWRARESFEQVLDRLESHLHAVKVLERKGEPLSRETALEQLAAVGCRTMMLYYFCEQEWESFEAQMKRLAGGVIG